MGNVEIHPLTADRWADFERLFGPRGAYAGCWCMWPRLRSRDFAKRKGPENKEAMREVVESDEPPGLLAYVDGEPVGWVALDRRERLEHFEYSRKLKPLDRPEGLWSIVCFVIDKRHRRQGLMTRLLDAALEYARERGARVVEAYPIDPQGDLRSYHGFTGIASVFERVGFVKVGGTESDLVVRMVVSGYGANKRMENRFLGGVSSQCCAVTIGAVEVGGAATGGHGESRQRIGSE